MNAADERDFRDFVVARSGMLLRTGYLLTGDAGHAEDAVQAALTAVYLAWPRIRNRETVDAYARRTLVREIGSWRRRRRVQQVLTNSLPEPRLSPTSSGAEDRLVLRAALLQLAPQQRAVVVLRFYSDLSEADVAQTLGISVGSVKQHASRGLSRLRQVLEPAEAEARKQL